LASISANERNATELKALITTGLLSAEVETEIAQGIVWSDFQAIPLDEVLEKISPTIHQTPREQPILAGARALMNLTGAVPTPGIYNKLVFSTNGLPV
jgi:hypothetical protein